MDDPLCFIIMWDVPFCSADTGEDVDLELLVDDFITFYIAGEQNFICIYIYIGILIHMHCRVLLFSGQETTSNLLSFAVVLLHLNPDILER